MGAGRRVLVVEDDHDMRLTISLALELAGFAVVQCGDATSAVRMLEGEPVDAVITDVMMPGGSGVSLLGHIRSNPRLRSLPVIVVTGSPNEEIDWAVGREERTALVRKPFDPKGLVRALERLLAG